MKLLSEFIGFPIGLYVENLKEKGVTDSEEDGTRGGQARHEDIFYLRRTSPSSWRNDAWGIWWFFSQNSSASPPSCTLRFRRRGK